MRHSTAIKAAASLAAISIAATPVIAKQSKEVEVVQCEASYGSLAVTDGDTQGWSEYGLSSPRAMLGAIVQQSGCFELHNAASGQPADYLMSAVAGSQEEIDQTMSIAKGAMTEGLIRSGAAGTVLSKVPFAGGMMGMFGGLGGKKKTITAGLRLMSPMNGQTLITGTGQSQKSVIKVMGASEWIAASKGTMGQYATSKDGKMVASAFVEAYNQMVSQAGILASMPKAQPAAVEEANEYVVAVDSALYSSPSTEGSEVRALRADTVLIPTGNRDGLFVEVSDNYGIKGWVSVEDLR